MKQEVEKTKSSSKHSKKLLSSSSKEMETMRTFETRLKIDPLVDEALHRCAELFAHIRHRLFADIASGKKSHELKNDYLSCYQITARHFNALRVQVEGKIASIKKRRPALIAEASERIDSLKAKIKRLIKTKANPQLIHQKKRRLHLLETRLQKLKQDHEKGTIRCCFGSKKLFRAQFNLESNGYTTHQEWLKDWKDARTRELFFLGSKDETSGNQTCTATLEPDEILQLRVRLPDALGLGKYLLITQQSFNYGKQEILNLLKNRKGQAISWRLFHDKKGWRLFATFDIKPPACTSHENTGVVGLDINVNHLALVETDRFGNPLTKKTIPINLYGKSSNQTRAIIGDAAALAMTHAQEKNKPLIIENLDLQKKKAQLREKNRTSHARMLSSFAYHSLITHLKSRATKKGVLIKQVNPAYTTVIGRIKFAKRYGLSIHQAAALTIGRRYLSCSEKVPSSLREIPDGKDSHVTLLLPERNRSKHVWSLWKQLSKKLQVALAAHSRTASSRSSSTVKTAPEMKNPKVDGEIPAHESSELLLS